MKKFYDCSNSPEAPSHHPESNGPCQNDIVRGLKKYGHIFGWECIEDPTKADIIFTNDIYPKDIIYLPQPKVKRMDGVYWYRDLVKRNIPLNKAAQLSNAVIFISEYSKDSYYKLYGKELPYNVVIPNCVDDNVYFPNGCGKYILTLVASASNWARPEKRLKDTINFMSKVAPEYKLNLIGQCDENVPENVIKHGYISEEKRVNEIMNCCEAMINFSYRDPLPKTVCQAVSCRLPIFYANSGGTHETVMAGVAIPDPEQEGFGNDIPELSVKKMKRYWDKFKKQKEYLSYNAQYSKMSFMNMLSQYFRVFYLLCPNK